MIDDGDHSMNHTYHTFVRIREYFNHSSIVNNPPSMLAKYHTFVFIIYYKVKDFKVKSVKQTTDECFDNIPIRLHSYEKKNVWPCMRVYHVL